MSALRVIPLCDDARPRLLFYSSDSSDETTMIPQPDSPQLGQQILRVNWFRKDFEFMSLGTCAFQQVSRGCLAGKEKYLARGQHAANQNGGLNAIHVRHDHVTDHQIRTEFTGTVHGGDSGIGRDSIKATLIQDCGKSIRNQMLVIHNQYFSFSAIIIQWHSSTNSPIIYSRPGNYKAQRYQRCWLWQKSDLKPTQARSPGFLSEQKPGRTSCAPWP